MRKNNWSINLSRNHSTKKNTMYKLIGTLQPVLQFPGAKYNEHDDFLTYGVIEICDP